MSKPHSPKGLRISDEVHKALRIRAAETGESMGEIAERALRKELGMMEKTYAEEARDQVFKEEEKMTTARVHDYETGAELGAIGGDLLRRYIEEIADDYVGAVDGAPYGYPGYTIYVDGVEDYLKEHGHCYAVVDVADEGTGTVAKVHYDLRDSGDPGLTSIMEEITGPGQRWVYVPGGCSPGDEVRIDGDGCAVALAQYRVSDGVISTMVSAASPEEARDQVFGSYDWAGATYTAPAPGEDRPAEEFFTVWEVLPDGEEVEMLRGHLTEVGAPRDQ